MFPFSKKWSSFISSYLIISDIDECANVTCNATTSTGCIDLINDYTCDCVAGWSGNDCDASKNNK